MDMVEVAAQGRSRDVEQAGGDFHAGRGDDLYPAGRKFTLQRLESRGTVRSALALIDVGDDDTRAPLGELRLEQISPVHALDQQNAQARGVREDRVQQQALGIESSVRRHGHAIARFAECPRGGRTDRGKHDVAPFIEKRTSEPHRVGTRKNDEVESFDGAYL